jgi:hypothetical protein
VDALKGRVAVLALTAILFAGCGGGGDPGAKVEASLRQYISARGPEGSFLPVGAGPPRVVDNACRDRHVKTKKGQEVISRTAATVFRNPVALWSCVVRFERLGVPTLVAVDDDEEVVWVAPGRFEQFGVR